MRRVEDSSDELRTMLELMLLLRQPIVSGVQSQSNHFRIELIVWLRDDDSPEQILHEPKQCQ
mgnify:CR=1 FL=1